MNNTNTNETFKPLLTDETDQAIFDRVASHLIGQGDVSLLETGQCAYRGERGRKCAVGALIPDELYETRFEGQRVWDLYHPCGERLFALKHTSLLQSLQQVHDLGPQPEGFIPGLRQVAAAFGLSTAVLGLSTAVLDD